MIKTWYQDGALVKPALGASSLLMCMVMLVACSSPPSHWCEPVFRSLITDNGTKLFEVALPGSGANEVYLPNTRGTPPKTMPEPSDEQLAILVESMLVNNKFCRNGYMLLGRHAGETTRKLRGECRDRANNEDRKRFPNTITFW